MNPLLQALPKGAQEPHPLPLTTIEPARPPKTSQEIPFKYFSPNRPNRDRSSQKTNPAMPPPPKVTVEEDPDDDDLDDLDGGCIAHCKGNS